MSEVKQFRLPDVGEGLTEADIVSWHVKPGDSVTLNQVIVEIETAKAVVELPSPYEGVVTELLADEGATVDVGTPIIAVDVSGEATTDGAGPDPGSATTTPAPDSTPAADSAPEHVGASAADSAPEHVGASAADSAPEHVGASAAEVTDPVIAATSTPAGAESPLQAAFEPGIHGSPAPKVERQAVLVGYGVKLGTTKRRQRKAAAQASSTAPPKPSHAPAPETTPAPASASAPAPTASSAPSPSSAPAPAQAPSPGGNGRAGVRPAAKPPVRKLAKDLGVDLAGVAGTGPDGTITREDVQAAVAAPAAAAAPLAPVAPSATPAVAPAAVSAWTAAAAGPREERVAVRGVRKHTAAAVSASAFTAPHVTEFLQVDVTAMMAAVERLRELPEFAGLRVSPLLLVARALLVAAGRHPMINSSWDEGAQEIVVKHYVNLGIAAATERGLIVPNIKDAHALSLPGLAGALAQLTATAREGKAQPADLTGGTITITNVGVFGVDAGTPILTPGEAAILAFGQVREMPWVHEGQLAVRQVTTLSLSFDHRIVDGDLGSAFLRDVGAMLADPVTMLAWG
jgi:pyruvate dehydrogenase E2 component (dihydrolipoamide acetyltransferase)